MSLADMTFIQMCKDIWKMERVRKGRRCARNGRTEPLPIR